jgi:hypothetical protein
MWLAALAACTLDAYDDGSNEPIRLTGGTFVRGPLPADETATTPTVINAAGVGLVVTQGQATVAYSGLVSKDAYSVAVALPDAGSGYWVKPADGPDVTQDGNLLFSLNLEIAEIVPYGLQTLSFVAIGADGRGGPRYDVELCIVPESANGGITACDPSVMPPSDVLALSWDTQVDLDLVVITPSGKIVSAKDPTTALPDGTVAGTIPSDAIADESTGTITRDSNADCVIDGINLESLVFPGEPEHGVYQVYASLNRACGEAYVHFDLTSYHRGEPADDGTWPIVETPLAVGELLAYQASGGATLGTFLLAVEL